ncbi:hypothetical protein ACQZV8_09615 [Magnetococcales bacterium HHB-1]
MSVQAVGSDNPVSQYMQGFETQMKQSTQEVSNQRDDTFDQRLSDANGRIAENVKSDISGTRTGDALKQVGGGVNFFA